MGAMVSWREVALGLGVLAGCPAPSAPKDAPLTTHSPSDPIADADGDSLPQGVDCDDADPSVGGPEVPYDGVDRPGPA